jgi:hypothetical protein
VASAENVDVQVRHGLAAVRAVVDDEPEAVWRQTQLVRDFGGLEQNVSEQLPVFSLRLADSRNDFFRKNQNMHGRLRVDVADGENQIVFIDNRRRNLAGDDFFKRVFIKF